VARSAAAQPGKPSLGARVLVAEDDEGLGEVLARGLPEHGYVVGLVSDGETAAAYFRHYTYQVAVVDWLMPRQRMNWPGSACSSARSGGSA
jgi:CheY-like chemotaxis protein